jgi:integrase/recombinase XerD
MPDGSEITASSTQAELARQIGAADVVASYLAELDATEKTKEVYRRALRHFVGWLETSGIKINQSSRADILTYKKELEDSRSAATINLYLTAVRSLYAWLDAKGAYPNIAHGIKGVRRKAVMGHDALTIEQAKEILSDRGYGKQSARDYAMVNLMVRRGLRTIEVARANVGDVRQIAGKAVLYVQGKGHAAKDDFVILGEECLKPIYAYLAYRGNLADSAPLFASIGNRNEGGRLTTRTISRIVKAAYRRQGIADPHITAHSLRHTAVTLALVGGASLQEAQAMARHANISTTLIYAHNLKRMNAGAEKSVDSMLAS